MDVTEDRASEEQRLPFTSRQNGTEPSIYQKTELCTSTEVSKNAQKKSLKVAKSSENDMFLCLLRHGSRLEVEKLSSVQGKVTEIVKK